VLLVLESSGGHFGPPLLPRGATDDLAGTWVGEAAHNGETASIILQLDRDRSGELNAFVSIPAIHLWRSAWGKVGRTGTQVKIGPVALVYALDKDTLATTLPDAIVPVYSMPVVFRRSADMLPPRRSPPNAPLREPAWTLDTGAPIWADATFARGSVYIGADDGTMRAIDARSGTSQWSFRAGGAIRARPALADGDVLFQADDGFLYRLDGKTGIERWRTRIAARPMNRVPLGDRQSRYENRASGVVLDGARAYVGTHEHLLLAIDATRGTRLWEFNARDSIVATAVVHGGNVYVGSFDGRVYAVDASSGSLVWTRDTGGAVTATAAIQGDTVFVGSRSYDFLALKASNGSPVWTRYFWFSWAESPASIVDRTVFTGSSDAAKVFALDVGNGHSKWETDVGGSAWGQPAVSSSSVFIGVAGTVHYLLPHQGMMLALDRRTGTPIWRYPAAPPAHSSELTPYGFAGSVALGDGMVFAGGLDGRVYAFKQ
jgi:outer membrane protein assembly factor BamB